MNDIHKKIKQIRVSKGIKQKQVADKAGIKPSSYFSIEEGKTKNISIEVGKGIARALDIPFTKLFEIEDTGSEIEHLKATVYDLEKKVVDLMGRIEEKDLLIEMFKNEKVRISKILLNFLEENHYNQTFQLNEESSLSPLQKKDIQNIVINGTMSSIAKSYLVDTGLITESELNNIVPKYKGIVRPAGPIEEEESN